ncbi:MAG: type II toxin-antitoxin system VapC family toxin [Candidatus Riflebacteria bacterium]|nr:type II toxin-antitoxin system VapC family toxin [Candidatus Riflebacteria bacterium]
MNYLLDTHAFLWWTLDDRRLSDGVRRLLQAPPGEVYLSAASVWEIALKHSLGKIVLRAPLTRVVLEEADRCGLRSLPITREHACRSGDLPLHHRDPFDRLLVAQAQLEGLGLVTTDQAIRAYDVPVFW